MIQAEQLSASLEDYLEAIFNIISDKGAVRAKDIARYLSVKAGSVTVALKVLARTEHINYQPYEVITLTSKGLKQAKEVIRKHEILRDFFVDILGAEFRVAEEGACKIEHVIPEVLVKRLISFTEFIRACSLGGSDVIEKFHGYFNKHQFCSTEECKGCLREDIDRVKNGEITETTTQKTLLDIPRGEKCVVKKVKKKEIVAKRLAEMGINRGAVIEVERVAPLGDPIEVKVRGYHLAIRKKDAQSIEVE